MTCKKENITPESKIYVIFPWVNISFKIFSKTENICPLFILILSGELVSYLIEEYLNKTGLEKTDIKKFIFNSKELKSDLTIKEAGLKNNSEIIVIMKEKNENKVSINFKFNNNYFKIKEPVIIENLKTYLISTLIEQFKFKSKLYDLDLEYFTFKEKELNENLTIEQTGLKNK